MFGILSWRWAIPRLGFRICRYLGVTGMPYAEWKRPSAPNTVAYLSSGMGIAIFEAALLCTAIKQQTDRMRPLKEDNRAQSAGAAGAQRAPHPICADFFLNRICRRRFDHCIES